MGSQETEIQREKEHARKHSDGKWSHYNPFCSISPSLRDFWQVCMHSHSHSMCQFSSGQFSDLTVSQVGSGQLTHHATSWHIDSHTLSDHHSFIYLYRYLLSHYYVSDSILGLGDRGMNKTRQEETILMEPTVYKTGKEFPVRQ